MKGSPIWRDLARAVSLDPFKRPPAKRPGTGGCHGATKIAQRERQSGPDHDRRSGHAAALRAARRSRAARAALRLRARPVRRLHRARRRQGGALLRDCRCRRVDAQQKVVTLEGLGTPEKPHPVQQAFIDEQAAQCGYCINGMIMQSAAFLAENKKPTEARDQAGARRQPLPLRHACPHRQRGHARGRACVREAAMNDRMPSRRDILKGGGALVVSFSLAGTGSRSAGPGRGAQARGARPRSTASSRSMPTARSRSIPARSISAPGCDGADADRRRRARRAARPQSTLVKATPR